MIEPVVIEPVIQKASGDCAAACLAMMLGVSYADIVAATPSRKRMKKYGLTERQIINVGKRLGMAIGARLAPPEEDEFGMLDLYNEKKEGHVALHLRGGQVLDPADGFIYTDVAAFLLAKEWQIQGFYWRKA